MKERQIHITDADMDRLRRLLDRMQVSNKDRAYLEDLEDELDRAVLVPADKVPPHTVTMNTKIRVKTWIQGKTWSSNWCSRVKPISKKARYR